MPSLAPIYNSFTSNYTYLSGTSGNTTGLVSQLSLTKNVNSTQSTVRQFGYTYDANGNILTISEALGSAPPAQKVKYYYNGHNELVREDNLWMNKTIAYTYDAGRNILKKTEYAFTTGDLAAATATATHTYSYTDSNWKDKLTSFDGKAITYDQIGNPLTYNGWSYTWEQGRQLSKMVNGTTTDTFKYNSDGLRTQKTVNGVTTKYYYEGGQLSWQTDGTNTIHYVYDGSGSPVYMVLNGTIYYYELNVQGDVIGLLDKNMGEVVTYSYDTWGKLLSTGGTLAATVGATNPLRYRGYYYDTETGLFYVGSRYYDPVTCRMLNADSQLNPGTGLTGMNMFAYCNNNPVNMADPNGHMPFFVITAAIGAVVGAVAGGIIAAKTGKNVWAGIGIGAAGGALLGCGIGAGLGMISGFGAAATASQVGLGLSGIAATAGSGGLLAAGKQIVDNVSRSAGTSGTVLYSGGQKAAQAATDFAKNTGGKTIDMTPIGRMADIAAKANPEQFKPIWSQASSAFCKQASGTVNAFVSNGAYRGVNSIFWSVEMPTLMNNPRVTDVVIHIFE